MFTFQCTVEHCLNKGVYAELGSEIESKRERISNSFINSSVLPLVANSITSYLLLIS